MILIFKWACPVILALPGHSLVVPCCPILYVHIQYVRVFILCLITPCCDVLDSLRGIFAQPASGIWSGVVNPAFSYFNPFNCPSPSCPSLVPFVHTYLVQTTFWCHCCREWLIPSMHNMGQKWLDQVFFSVLYLCNKLISSFSVPGILQLACFWSSYILILFFPFLLFN